MRYHKTLDYMQTNNREIMLYFDSKSSPHKKTAAYARSMNKHPKELLNKALPEYQNHIRGREFTMEGWLKILQYNTHLLKAPIAIRGKKAILCESPTDIFKLNEVGEGV